MRHCAGVYVLILNWNHKEITIECVESVLKSAYPKFRIVVIDNGSTDGSVGAFRARFAKCIDVIENKTNLGYAQGFNVGLKYGFEEKRADYCLVMNNDTVISPESITALVQLAKTDNTIGFVTGKVYYYDKPMLLQTVGKENHAIFWNGNHIGNGEEDTGQYDCIRELHFADDIFTLVSKHLYFAIGGYNPLFFLQGEEYDWQARAKSAGFKIFYTHKAKLWHKVSMTLGKDSTLKSYYDARNPMLVILLHKPVPFFRRYLRYHFLFRILRSSLIYLKRGRLSPALAKWQGFFSGVGWGLRNKKLTLRHFV
jgi:GT2 family glycosyltransferase